MSHAQDFMKEAATIALEIDADAIERMAQGLAQVRARHQ